MPREHRKRGRREEKKLEKKHKRQKVDHENPAQDEDQMQIEGDEGDDFISFGLATTQPRDLQQPPDDENVFHGLLSPEEQEYYAHVNTKIVANDFESNDDRATFVEAVYRESEGKELKIASSQSCSRYLEKIIRLSTAEQLRGLFATFSGNFSYLVRHRFGSHCCETLFLEAAKHVGRDKQEDEEGDALDPPTLETLFLQAASELEPSMGYLLTERFASHTVRVLFLVLSGQPLDDDSVKNILASKKKEKLEGPALSEVPSTENQRLVPKSFKPALSKLISAAVSSLDTTYLRALATHPTGNPVLQLLVYLGLSTSSKHQGQDGAVLQKLLPDESLEEDTESAKFVSGLIYDPAGSHLVEIFVTKLPGKAFKKLYKNVLKSRLASMAKNDVASYVAIKVLERLSKDDLAEVKVLLLAELHTLLARRKSVVTSLIERCVVRRVDLEDVTAAIKSECGDDGTEFLSKLLQLELPASKTPAAAKKGESAPEETHPKYRADTAGSLLAQAMLKAPLLCVLVQNSLMTVPVELLIELCRVATASRAIQVALTSEHSTGQFRRQFVPRFQGNAAALALDLAGSYVVDALWTATRDLHFLKERLAHELARSETKLRESPSGRIVWKKWGMDVFLRRPAEWRATAKDDIQGAPARDTAGLVKGQPQGPAEGTGNPEKKSAIQLARERHMQRKMQSGKPAAKARPVVPANA